MLSAPILFGFVILIRSHLKYPSFYVFELIISAFLLILWTILAFPIYLAPELFIPDIFTLEQIVLLEHLTTIFGALGTIVFIFVLSNSIQARLLLIPRIAVVLFSFIVGTKFIQFYIPASDTLYGLKTTDNGFIRTNLPILQVVILVAFSLLILTIYLFSKKQFNLPKGFVSDSAVKYYKVSLTIFAIGIVCNILGLSISDYYYSGIFYLISRLFLTIGAITIFQQFTQNSELIFSERGNPLPIIRKGIVGWIIAGNRSIGPEDVISSNEFKENYNIPDLEILSVNLITSAAMGREEFHEKLIVVPLNHKNADLTAIGYSLKYMDSTITDPRKNGQSEIVFALLIPSFLMQYLENLSEHAMKRPISKHFKEDEDLDVLIKRNPFESLVIDVIRDLTTKDFY